jgi:hypothetical protein
MASFTEEPTYAAFDDLPVVSRPQDHRPKQDNPQRAEAQDRPLTFTWDGEDWTILPSRVTGLEFLAALEDEEIIKALRLLLGKEQAARLIKGRRAEDVEPFFNAAGEAAGTGNQ